MLLSSLLWNAAFSQPKPIPINKVEKLAIKQLFCLDSIGNKSDLCSLGLDGFDVIFKNVYIDKRAKTIRFVGKLSPGIPEVGIYINSEEPISIKKPIAYTTYDNINYMNDGNFDISVTVGPGLSLYFYHPRYFLRQFEIHKLWDEN